MLTPNVLNILHSTEAIPPQYWSFSPTCTAVIPTHVLPLPPHMYCYLPPPPQYWRYPSTILNTLHSTDVIPYSTDVIPRHVLMLSPHCTEPPPQYWSYPSTVLKLSPHNTEASPRCTEQPPMYWTTLHSTESTLHDVSLSTFCNPGFDALPDLILWSLNLLISSTNGLKCILNLCLNVE